MAQILATGKQRSAKTSAVVVGAQTLAFASWKANVSGDDLGTRNFLSYVAAEGQAYDEGIIGFIGCDGDYGGDWDAGVNPVDYSADAPPGLYPRDDLPQVSFYTSTLDDVFWEFPYQRIINSNVSADVSALVLFNCSYKSQGQFNFPTGSV